MDSWFLGQSKHKETSIKKKFKSEYEDSENTQDKSDLSYVPDLPQTIIREIDIRGWCQGPAIKLRKRLTWTLPAYSKAG